MYDVCVRLNLSGLRYFVTFVDDFSRATWIFIIKSRKKIFAKFSVFCSLVQNQFNTTVKTLRSDNAKEYFLNDFLQYTIDNGIIHESLCAYTPQQNGVAERKNRHILEVARTMMIHRHVPHHFWVDVVLTACYLINRMASSVLDDVILYNILYPFAPLFPVPPKIFGCACYVYDTRPSRTKLDPKSLIGIFLEYSGTQKGYRFYSPTIR
jgi:Integrase core domain